MNALLDAGVAAPAPRALAPQLRAWAERRGVDASPASAFGGVIAWSRLHGLVSLELTGAYEAMGLDPEALLET